MSRKRRIFDIELPDEIETATIPATAAQRRGPMASAIAENADALQARRTTSQAIQEENETLAHEYVALRAQGLVVQDVPLMDVHSDLLVRDRIPGEDEQLAELVTSIRDTGLSNPIRVLERPNGGYELVQGFRRLSAYRSLYEETGQSAWARIPALIMHGEGDVADLYRRMVDENVIRKDLSFAEMAHAARNYLKDPATDAKDLSEAVAALFQSAPYSKRSYIRSFAALLDEFGDVLRFPTAIPRGLGVSVARQAKEADASASLRAALVLGSPQSAEDELAVLRAFVESESVEALASDKTARNASKVGKARTKTTFHIQSRAGQVKCTAGPGRLEIKVDQDFSSIDRAQLEQAIASLIDGLG